LYKLMFLLVPTDKPNLVLTRLFFNLYLILLFQCYQRTFVVPFFSNGLQRYGCFLFHQNFLRKYFTGFQKFHCCPFPYLDHTSSADATLPVIFISYYRRGNIFLLQTLCTCMKIS